jgi:hypothetical protein
MTRIWNNLHQVVRSKSKDWKAKKFKVWEAIKVHSQNRLKVT